MEKSPEAASAAPWGHCSSGTSQPHLAGGLAQVAPPASVASCGLFLGRCIYEAESWESADPFLVGSPGPPTSVRQVFTMYIVGFNSLHHPQGWVMSSPLCK